MASLESVRLGFQFDDKTFINISTESDNYRRIKDGQNGLYYANRLISEVSERFGLKLNPDASLLQIHEGGLCPAETVDGQLYVIESIDTIELYAEAINTGTHTVHYGGLGLARQKVLKAWTILAIILIVVGMLAGGLGLGQTVTSDEFPFGFGIPMIAALMTLITVAFSLLAVREGRKYPTGEETGACLKCLVHSYTIFSTFTLLVAVVAFILSGLWGTIECLGDSDAVTYLCDGEKKPLLMLSIFTAIFCMSIVILLLIGMCLYCCNVRAFGIRSDYERMRERQYEHYSEQIRRENQPAFPAPPPGFTFQLVPLQQEQQYPYGQGQGPGQGRLTPTAPPSVAPAGYTYQLVPVQEGDQAPPGTVTPTAPPAGYGDPNVPASMQYRYEIRDTPQHEKTDEDLPPSYSDVVKR